MNKDGGTFWMFWLTFIILQDNQRMHYALGDHEEVLLLPAFVRKEVVTQNWQKYFNTYENDLGVEMSRKTDVRKDTKYTTWNSFVKKKSGIHKKRSVYHKNDNDFMENMEFHEDLSNNFRENVGKLLGKNDEAIDNKLSEADEVDYENQFLVKSTRRARIVPDKLKYTDEITIKQGRVMGIVRNFQNSTGLRSVNQFLGLPYAEAPVGSRRFMPPGAPLPWQGLKIARHFPPICPQKLPDVSAQSGSQMSPGRYDHLTRLLPYLRNESEDCLYLNIYAPRKSSDDREEKSFPVIVYIHGESFEWNSGNAYDGSVMASYGDVIVVTINYRLGILGFMKPSISENAVANFGLLDQIAALHWIKENIGYFSGDKDRVTLMGHNTGAACINYLMVSPVSKGLFHRALLMSGSAMSSWANTKQANKLTIQIAKSLNCPLNDANEQMLTCLRQKDYREILKTQRPFPKFLTPITPIVDGYVIPNDPAKAMGIYSENFHRYDLMFGVTESESYHTIGSLALKEGFRDDERDSILRSYMQNRFDIRPDLALAATLKKYNDIYTNPSKGTNLEHRDLVLDMLSDATVVGPLVQTGLYHADINQRTFMYVFGHNSVSGPHVNIPYSVAGEDLAFIFGAPLAAAGPFHNNYSAQEKLLSEAVITYWTNFAKTGNPKSPWKENFINLHAMEWDHYDVDWPEFNKRTQAYVNIGIPPSVGYKYRQIYTSFWNREIPDELNQIAVLQKQQNLQNRHTQFATSIENVAKSNSDIIPGHVNKYGSRDNSHDDPVRTLKLLLQEPYEKPTQPDTGADNMYNAPPTFGVAKQKEGEEEEDEGNFNVNTVPTNGLHEIYSPPIYGMENKLDTPPETEDNVDVNKKVDQTQDIAKSETTLHLLIALIIVFIIINLVIYSTFLLKRKKKVVGMKRKLGGILSYDGATDDDLKRSKQTTQHDGDESYILDIVRKSNTYEIVKMESTPTTDKRFGMTRQLSTSTVDTHTKVCEWMSNANLTRVRNDCKDMQNGCHVDPKNAQQSSSYHSSLFSNDSFKKQPDKVSVAVDATSMTRGNSVLCQEPIEITKLKMEGRNIIICQDVEVADQELLTPQNSVDDTMNPDIYVAATLPEYFYTPVFHQHSRSDPLKMYYGGSDEKITSFMDNDNNFDSHDINVTSRTEDNLHVSLTPEHQLMMIKRRNYPKVLPTANGTLQNSPIMTADLSKTYKRNSLPPNSFVPNLNSGKQSAPIPPPRTVSTLDRKLCSSRNSRHFTTSPLMLAKDCTEEEEEPAITENTLIVGPLIPKSKSNHHNDTLKKTCNTSDDIKKERETEDEKIQKVDLTPLSGVFQTFESNSNSQSAINADATAPPGTHHTEIIYAIDMQNSNETTPALVPTSNDVVYAEVVKKNNSQEELETVPHGVGDKEEVNNNSTRLSSVSSTGSTLSSSSSSTGTVRTEFKKTNRNT